MAMIRTHIAAAVFLGSCLVLPAILASQREAPHPQPGTKWTEEQFRRAVAPARVGKILTPRVWPGKARVAVCLSFDVDNESYLLAAGETSPNILSTGDFGAQTGLPRVLRLLDKHNIAERAGVGSSQGFAVLLQSEGRRSALASHLHFGVPFARQAR